MTQAIRWTPEQLAEYNARANPKPQPVIYATPKPAKVGATYTCCRVPMTAKFRSKAEAEFAQMLEAEWERGAFTLWRYESLRLRIGPSAWTKPDFYAVGLTGKIEIIEVKGAYIREAGRLRLQAAARQYPEFSWRLAQKVKGAWTLEVVQ